MNAPTTIAPQQGSTPPRMKGGLPWIGQMFNFAANPYKFVEKVSNTAGDVASFTLLGQNIVLLTGDEASELFYRSSDEQLDQSAAYKLMTPIFGEGIIFDAPIERKTEQLKMLMPALRMEAMRDHSHKIVQEVEDIIANWGDSGEIELVEFMKQLTINTASHCLLGREFRYELSDEFAHIYHDLEQGVNPIAYNFPNLPIPKFKRRDRARVRLRELVGAIVKKREAQTEKPSDLFQSLIDMRYADGTKLSDNEITGMLIGAIFAGHHTSSGTAAWVLLELLKDRSLLRKAQAELDAILGDSNEVSFQSVRDMNFLENVLKEVLRLHPPLIILMRKVSQDLHIKNFTIKAGDMVWASPPVTHRMERLFSNPMKFDPDRFSAERKEDKNLMAYQPFGGGRHKCSGNAFAMFQIKAIFAVLLRRYDFELMAPPQTYVDDYTQMIVQPKSPCKVRYRLRKEAAHPMRGVEVTAEVAAAAAAAGCPFHSNLAAQAAAKEAPKPKIMKVVVDRGLCQGHAMCMGEAPETFHVDANSVLEIRKPVVDAADVEKIERAVKFCPNSALKVVEE